MYATLPGEIGFTAKAVLEHIARTLPTPAKRDYIRVERRDGRVFEGEVLAVYEYSYYTDLTLSGEVCTISRGELDSNCSDEVMWWAPKERPKKAWKVGDVVPPNTVVGKEWVGLYSGIISDHTVRGLTVSAQGSSSKYRTIVWIAND